MPFRFRSALLCAFLLVSLLAACKNEQPPPDPGLAQEGFGSSARLGEPLPASEQSPVGSGLKVSVVTADELANAAPYNGREAAHDLLLVLPAGPETGGASVAGELRCYMADKGSVATLLGQPLRTLTPDAADSLCAVAGVRTAAPGETHCEYTFAAPPAMKRCELRLMLSFDERGCFAARLRLVSTAPQRF